MTKQNINNRVDKFIKNPKKALFVLAIPTFIGMLFQALYNVVDTAFIGRLGSNALAGLTYAFPIFFIFIAINVGITTGMGSRISRFLGEKNKKQAENAAIHGLFISLIFAVLVFLLGTLFAEPLFRLLGASGEVLQLAMDYINIVFIGIFFMFPMWVFLTIFTSQGDAKTGMKIQIFSLVLNIILDPILIYGLGYGVKGAAIATSIAFFFGLILSLYYARTKSVLHIGLSSFKFSKKILKDILKVGFPASLMMITMSIFFMFVNKFMSTFSFEHVAAFGISFRLESLLIMPIVAMSFAVLTLSGMFYGAKRYDLLKKISIYGIKLSFLIALVTSLIIFLFPVLFLRIFTDEVTLVNIGIPYIRLIVFTYPFIAISLLISRIIQGMGEGLPGLGINLFRTLLIPVPLSAFLIFTLGYGYLSIPLAIITGVLASDLVAIIWLKSKFDKLK
jgi:putative MATE family efflux protein